MQTLVQRKKPVLFPAADGPRTLTLLLSCLLGYNSPACPNVPYRRPLEKVIDKLDVGPKVKNQLDNN